MIDSTHLSSLMIEETVMQSGAGQIEQVYCAKCNLATPRWRNKRLHCAEPLRQKNGGRAKG